MRSGGEPGAPLRAEPAGVLAQHDGLGRDIYSRSLRLVVDLEHRQ